MTSTAIARLREGYVAGLLLGIHSIRAMTSTGLLGFGLTHCCRLMKRAELGEQWRERLQTAPTGGCLAVDFKEEFGVNEIMNRYLEVDPSPK